MKNYIVDDIGSVVAAMRPLDSTYGQPLLDYMTGKAKNTDKTLAPFYLYGHRLEIANELTAMNIDRIAKFNKYPLIALRMDIGEKVRGQVIDFTLNIAILAFTDKNYNAEERYANVFKPVLYPLYERFMQELGNSGLFFWDKMQDVPEHTKYDRPYWGTEDKNGNTANIFSDPLDAIEIIDLKISQEKKC